MTTEEKLVALDERIAVLEMYATEPPPNKPARAPYR